MQEYIVENPKLSYILWLSYRNVEAMAKVAAQQETHQGATMEIWLFRTALHLV